MRIRNLETLFSDFLVDFRIHDRFTFKWAYQPHPSEELNNPTTGHTPASMLGRGEVDISAFTRRKNIHKGFNAKTINSRNKSPHKSVTKKDTKCATRNAQSTTSHNVFWLKLSWIETMLQTGTESPIGHIVRIQLAKIHILTEFKSRT